MAWFRSLLTREGSVFNQKIENFLVHIVDPKRIELLKAEHRMFKMITDEEAARLRAASQPVVLESEKIKVDIPVPEPEKKKTLDVKVRKIKKVKS